MSSVVYISTDVMKLSLRDVDYIESFLPESRTGRASRYRREQDRRSCIMAYFLLLFGLSKNYGIRAIPDIEYTSYGKPYFKDNDNICFNISHFSRTVCCGISEFNIGVDVDGTVKDLSLLEEGVLSENEKKELKISERPEIFFTRLWTLKESYLKYLGTGLSGNLEHADFSGNNDEYFERYNCHFLCKAYDGWSLAVCSSDIRPEIIVRSADYYVKKISEI